MKVMQDPRGYQRVYGKPVHETEYRCDSCDAVRLGFGWCKRCGAWIDKVHKVGEAEEQ